MVEQALTTLLDCTFEVLGLRKPQGEWGRDELPREVKSPVREKVFFLVLHKDLQRMGSSWWLLTLGTVPLEEADRAPTDSPDGL